MNKMNKFNEAYNKILKESISNSLTEDEIKQELIKIEKKMEKLRDSYYGNPPYNESQELTKKHKFLMKQLARIKSGFNSNPSEDELQKISKYESSVSIIEKEIKNLIDSLEDQIIDFKSKGFNFSEANRIYQKMKNLQNNLKLCI